MSKIVMMCVLLGALPMSVPAQAAETCTIRVVIKNDTKQSASVHGGNDASAVFCYQSSPDKKTCYPSISMVGNGWGDVLILEAGQTGTKNITYTPGSFACKDLFVDLTFKVNKTGDARDSEVHTVNSGTVAMKTNTTIDVTIPAGLLK